MRLSECEIRPGTVLEAIDENGTIKAACAGVFSEEDDPEMLPPVYPFMQSSASSFNQPHPNDLIWVWIFHDNPQELFYTFRSNTADASSHILSKKPKDSQILASRDAGFSKSQLYYSTDDGWVMQNDSADITIDKDKNIRMTRNDPHRTVEVNDDGISLGSEGKSAEPAVLGDQLTSALRKLSACLSATAESLKGNPYTAESGAKLESGLGAFESAVEKILSKNVTLD